MSSSLLRKGSRVAIFGLQGESSAALNGALGNVHAFDDQSCRWQVDIDCHGFKKVKEANLVALRENVRKPPVGSVMQKPMTIQRKTKLCRFGEACWRPNCHFAHEDERQRCTKLASLWDPDVLDDCQPPPASKQLDNDIVKLKTDISRHEAQINSSLRDLEELKDSLAVNCGGICDPDSQLATGSVDGCPLSTNDLLEDLQGQLASLQERFDSDLAAQVSNASDDIEARIVKVERMIGGDLEDRMRGALEAAVVPLAEAVSKKMVVLESQVSSLAVNAANAETFVGSTAKYEHLRTLSWATLAKSSTFPLLVLPLIFSVTTCFHFSLMNFAGAVTMALAVLALHWTVTDPCVRAFDTWLACVHAYACFVFAHASAYVHAFVQACGRHCVSSSVCRGSRTFQ